MAVLLRGSLLKKTDPWKIGLSFLNPPLIKGILKYD